MIGVLCNAAEAAAAAEFFELFKTPWEFYEEGQSYDVVISTNESVPPCSAPLLIIYGAHVTSFDNAGDLGTIISQVPLFAADGAEIPIYNGLATFARDESTNVCATCDNQTAAYWCETEHGKVLRVGYSLFQEVEYLLKRGQPLVHALTPTLDLHIALLRKWLLEAGQTFVEVPPSPYGTRFTVCLTHDIDFIALRQHRFDHTMWGFLYRATIGAAIRVLRGRLSFRNFVAALRSAVLLPFVHLGLCRDFWWPFEWYLRHEDGLPATYFLIPFKERRGARVPAPHRKRRATNYDVTDLALFLPQLKDANCEVGVHGIDSWHDADQGILERERVQSVAGTTKAGVRMHWLLCDEATAEVLDQAGYDYDATNGYNETPGYRAGTTQVFQPIGTRHLLELPLHIQDGALFYPSNLDLTQSEAWKLTLPFIQHVRAHGGVLTTLWHDRSHAPERFWGDFYLQLLKELKSCQPWFATASDCVAWFRARRSIRFERQGTSGIVATAGDTPSRHFRFRVHGSGEDSATTPSDVQWSGEEPFDISQLSNQRMPAYA